ncbi:MAG TPA: TlpA disulfide reductase family protein [Thermodesulfobacteriota bacterium]|nr:TlpA disulfide reductase family protein [Thermodesulfobacteriota bacterium]
MCRKEGPSLAKFYAQYQSQGLVFYRINTIESLETVRKFLEKESLQVPVLLDPSDQVERLFGVWAHPTSFLIDRKGLARYRIMGLWDWNNVQATSLIDQLMKER